MTRERLTPQLSSDDVQARRQRRFLRMLAFLAGFADTAGFVMLFGLFTAHVTGNLVIAAADIVHRGGAGAAAALLMIPVFLVSVVPSTLVMDFARARWPHRTLTLMVGIETLLLGGFFVAAVWLDPSHSSPDAPAVIIVGGLCVLAMGLQNTLAHEMPMISPMPTTMITGNLTQIMIACMHWLCAGSNHAHASREEAVTRLRLVVPMFLSFVLGAAVAAAGVVMAGYWCFAIPVAVAAAATVLSLLPGTSPLSLEG